MSLILLFLACLSAYLLLRPVINGAVYFPTHPARIGKYAELAALKPGDKVADLGSGDGRVLMIFAKHGIESHGYEVDPLLVAWSRLAIRRAGLQGLAFVHWQSFWSQNLEDFDAIVVYGFPHIMKRLGDKLQEEVRPGIPIISNNYTIPGWKPISKDAGIYLYKL